MERAFKIIEGSKVHQQLKKQVEINEQGKNFINYFFNKHGIESNPYTFGGEGSCNVPFEEYNKNKIYLAIDPTENDLASFGGQLCKPDYRGVSYFKKNSKILKDFQQECIDKEIIINNYKTDMRDYFKSMGWSGYSIKYIPFEDTWLVKINSEHLTEDDNPEGFEPIKLSEYHTYVESVDKNNE